MPTIQISEELARKTIGDLGENHELSIRLKEQMEVDAKYKAHIETARAFGSDDLIEVSDLASVSHGEDCGVYVSAWVWVPNYSVI